MKKNYSAYEIILKKRNNHSLEKDEISWFIENYTNKKIPDYQMSAFLMSVYFQSMTFDEVFFLTEAMINSGKKVVFPSKIFPSVIDKHSTGGVGDKASFIIAPIAAACGVKVPMMAGRGLGHTGGTIDKVESIPGFKTTLSLKEFQEQVSGPLGVCLIGQTHEIAPADKLIYGLRDVTATIESIPLITASILSKKFAEGASGIVMDIKVGQGAFMKNIPKALDLAQSMKKVAKKANRKIKIALTQMNSPLGTHIGNTLEIEESMQVLSGEGPSDTRELSLVLAALMIQMKDECTYKVAYKRAQEALDSGKALEIFLEMIKKQGGDITKIVSRAPVCTKLIASRSGVIKSMDTEGIGRMIVALGGGRSKTDDPIDHGVGMIIHKKNAEKVKEGDVLAEVFHHTGQTTLVKNWQNNIHEYFQLGKNKERIVKEKLILKVM